MLNIYINTWGNYNENGCDGGRWITLPMDETELEEIMESTAEAMHDDDPEWFVNDYEWTTEIQPREIEEMENIIELNEYIQELDDLDEWEQKTFCAACEVFGNIEPCDVDDYRLMEDVNNDYDLGYYWIEESGCYDLKNLGNLANYIDYEAFGRDVALESDGGFSSFGWVERC